MNANELADELEKQKIFATEIYSFHIKKAVTMLRQQQEKLTKYELRNEEQRNRIAHLEAENKFFKDVMGDVEILRKAQEK